MKRQCECTYYVHVQTFGHNRIATYHTYVDAGLIFDVYELVAYEYTAISYLI